MEIVQDRALLVRTRNPEKITEVIDRALIVKEDDGIYDVVVYWDLGNVMILKNLGFQKVISPILGRYDWPGIYSPMDHQRTTAAFLSLERRAYCLNDMGSGKTMAVAWAIDYLMRIKAVKRALIIAPLSILDTAWRSDMFKSIMHRRVAIAHGTREQRLKALNSGAEFVIINYDGIASIKEELVDAKFDFVVCDESTNLKNAQTKRWKNINALVRPETWVWAMTGTPIAQSPLDCYGQAKLVNPKSVHPYYGAFRDSIMIKASMFKWVPRPEAAEMVYKIMQPAIRFTKEECLDLPEQLYQTRELSMSPQQAAYYEKLRKELLIQAAGVEVSAVNAAVQMGKLLQIASGAVYADLGTDDSRPILEFDCKEKLDELLDIIEQASHKVLVFGLYQHTIERLGAFLTEQGITNDAIHGGVSGKKRAAIINRFQDTPDPRVLIIQPKAASHGLTLTAANVVVWFSPTTSTETYLQANARVHRKGQRNPTLVVHLCSSPVEKKLYKALEERTVAQASLLSMYENVLREKV
jgi:SNF2 family DNA or RNA helicase